MGVSKTLSLALALILSIGVFAQENLVWYVGSSGGLTFDKDGGAPVINSGISSPIAESISIISDCDGSPLAYTTGESIFDASGVAMLNGEGILGPDGGSSLNGAIFVSDPAKSGSYYLFTVDEEQNAGANGFRYHLIDLTLPGNGSVTAPLGEVVSKNNIVAGTGASAEFLAVTANTCGDSVWVVGHSYTGSDFWAVPLTSSGIGPMVVSNSGLAISGGQTARGSADFSPNQDKLAIATWSGGSASMFDFDFSTGAISSRLIISAGSFFGTEFSPDGTKIFFSALNFNTIHRYNLNTGNFDLIDNSGLYGDLERGPDGKMYIGRWTSSTYLAVISNPNEELAVDVDFVANGFNIGVPSGLGLPQIHTYLGLGLDSAKITSPFDLSTVCDKGGSLDLTSSLTCSSIWSGGSHISVEGVFDPSGLSAGNYNVYLSYDADGCVTPDTLVFTVEDCCPPLNVRDSILCEGSDAFHMGVLVDTGIGEWSLTNLPSGTGSIATFSDSIFDPSNYTKDITMVTDGEYELTYTYWNAPLSECPDSAVSIIEVDSFPRDIFLGTNASLIEECGTEYTFTAKGGLDYNWAAPLSVTTNPVTVNANGNYSLTVNSPTENCLTTDEIEIEFDQFPTAGIDVSDTIVCGAGEIKIGVNQAGLDYIWTGGGLPDGDSLLITSAGTYRVEIKSGPDGFCPTFDEVIVELAPPFDVLFIGLGTDTTLCPVLDSLIIRTLNVDGASFDWSMGENFEGADSSRLIFGFNDGDLVNLEITDAFGCAGDTSVTLNAFCDINDPTIPNIIIPDGNTNTTFIPINFPPGTEGTYESLYPVSEIVIYDRWGLVMHENGGYPSWKGTNMDGNPVSSGVYFWTLNLEDFNGNAKRLNGFVQVVR